MMDGLFSVLIAHYNNSRFLPEAIDSVIAQDDPNWEIVLVDDGSTDGFEAAIAPYAEDSRIRVFRNPTNMGCGRTKRLCVELASGALCTFLDPDDALVPWALMKHRVVHDKNPDCAIVHSTHYICNAALEPLRVAEYPRALPPGVPYLLLSDGSIHALASFKRELYLRTRGLSPNNRRAVDQDLYYLLEEQGSALYLDEPLYYYRIHPASISTSGNESKAALAHFAVIEDACQRRIAALDPSRPEERTWRRKYRTRLHKTRIIRGFRERKWITFLASLAVFPFVGGLSNMLSYVRKLPSGGLDLLKRTFNHDHRIEV